MYSACSEYFLCAAPAQCVEGYCQCQQPYELVQSQCFMGSAALNYDEMLVNSPRRPPLAVKQMFQAAIPPPYAAVAPVGPQVVPPLQYASPVQAVPPAVAPGYPRPTIPSVPMPVYPGGRPTQYVPQYAAPGYAAVAGYAAAGYAAAGYNHAQTAYAVQSQVAPPPPARPAPASPLLYYQDATRPHAVLSPPVAPPAYFPAQPVASQPLFRVAEPPPLRPILPIPEFSVPGSACAPPELICVGASYCVSVCLLRLIPVFSGHL